MPEPGLVRPTPQATTRVDVLGRPTPYMFRRAELLNLMDEACWACALCECSHGGTIATSSTK